MIDDVLDGLSRALVTTALIDLAPDGAMDQASVRAALRALKTQAGTYKSMLNVVPPESVVFEGKHPDSARILALTLEERTALRATMRSEGSAWLSRYVSRKNTLGAISTPPPAPTPAPVEEPLSDRPKLADAALSEQFVTHLPLYSLKVVAASQPAGEWGPGAHENIPERIGWARVTLRDRKLTRGMFLARVSGQSMDDGRTGLCDGVYAVFEFGADSLDTRPIVLVRGAFRDPETGSFAVKELARSTDAEGAVTAVSLRSRNPDSVRFPEIALDATRPESVQVIARFVEALAPDAFERAPKKKPPVGQRDLGSDEGIDHVRSRMERGIERFFEGAPPEIDEGGTPETEVGAAWLELNAPGPRGSPLSLVLSRLGTAPIGVETLRLSVGDVAANPVNLTKIGGRFAVPPSSEPYAWTATQGPGGAAVPVAAGLSSQHATAFRVDASDLGQRVAGTLLATGRRYRLLIPPALAEIALRGEGFETRNLENGWRYAEVELSAQPLPREAIETFRGLGLELGAVALSVEPVGDSPVRWRRTPRDARVACIAVSHGVTVRVRGPTTERAGEVALFALGPEGMRRLELPPGDEWFIALEALCVGRYAVHVEHARTAVASDRWLFAVEDDAPPRPVAEVVVSVGDDRVSVEGRAAREGDFRALMDEGAWSVATPALWRVDLRWNDRWLGALSANEEGAVDATRLRTLVGRALDEDRLGDLTLDFGDLGSLVLRHTRAVGESERVACLAPLVANYGEAVGSMALDLPQLRPMWITPLCRALGYVVRDLDETLRGAPPTGLVAFALDEQVRREGVVQTRCVAALVVSLTTREVDAALGSYLQGLCQRLQVTDGYSMVGTSWKLFSGQRRHPAIDLALRPTEFVQAFHAEEP